MSSPVVVSATHRYCAPAERVFDAWLTPWQASRFLFRSHAGTVMQCELQPEVGGAFSVVERRNASEGDESVFNVVHSGRYLEITRPRKLVFDVSVLAFSEGTTRVTVELATTTPQTCELTVTHELGDSRHAFSIQDFTRREWTNMLALLERELFPRRIGVHL
jgi:uncharacterized protein YndB with AHSA1/START domain